MIDVNSTNSWCAQSEEPELFPQEEMLTPAQNKNNAAVEVIQKVHRKRASNEQVSLSAEQISVEIPIQQDQRTQ